MLRDRGRPIGSPGRLAALLAAVALVPAVRANGAFPDEFSIHFPAAAPHRIFVGANFGLLVSEDDGATWRYACEPWVTEGSSASLTQDNVSFYQLTADGALLAQSREITRSEDDACTWPPSSGVIIGKPIFDMFPDPTDATLVLAVVVDQRGYYIVASHDGGKTFVDSAGLHDHRVDHRGGALPVVARGDLRDQHQQLGEWVDAGTERRLRRPLDRLSHDRPGWHGAAHHGH